MEDQGTTMLQPQDGIAAITAQDIPRVVEVWEASVRATHHFLTEADIQFLKSLVGDDLEQVGVLAGVRNRDGQAVGFVGVEGAEVAALFVHPLWHGQGIGRRLLTYAIETLGATELDVNEQNDQAVSFYRHMGFEVVSRSAMDGLGLPFPLLHMRLLTRGTA
jgi:putative acetyltransferase